MNIPSIVYTKHFQITFAAALSGLSGGAFGYIYASKKLAKTYARQAQEDINEVKEHYAGTNLQKVRKEGDYSDPVKLAEQIDDDSRYNKRELEALAAYIDETDAYSGVEKAAAVAPTEADPVIDITMEQNVWQSDDPETYFDWEEELKKRQTADIYVITKDEFTDQETDYSQDTLTYFEGDEVLADSRDQIVKDIAPLVDEVNLYRFGHGSDDPNVVYIRNVTRQIELEILHSDGKYSEEVLGYIEHSHRGGGGVRKFRGDDE